MLGPAGIDQRLFVLPGSIARLMTADRARPEVEESKFVGWRITLVHEEGFLRLMGFRKGDLVLAVSGRRVALPAEVQAPITRTGDLAAPLVALRGPRASEQAEFWILRDGKPLRLRAQATAASHVK